MHNKQGLDKLQWEFSQQNESTFDASYHEPIIEEPEEPIIEEP